MIRKKWAILDYEKLVKILFMGINLRREMKLNANFQELSLVPFWRDQGGKISIITLIFQDIAKICTKTLRWPFKDFLFKKKFEITETKNRKHIEPLYT